MPISNYDFICEMEAKINRARLKFPGNHHVVAAAIEEVGEVANALLERSRRNRSHEGVWNECVQAAAMFMRLAMEGDAEFPEYDPESGYRGPHWNGYKGCENE